ncbi:MAG: hypothetical protein KDC38_03090 [Planctomycetes bacterium]|nr:hypothetical protein [Planctomycetota bacterium]
MHPEIEKLKAIQKIDARLEVLLKEFERRPQALAAQGGEVGELHGRQKELHDMRQAKKVEVDRAELEVKSYDEKIASNRDRLSKATADAEYQGLVQQIDRFEREKAGVEEGLLRLMDEMDMIRRAERELAEELGVAEEHLTEDSEEAAKEIEAIRAEATRLVQERETARESIDAELLDKYDLLFSRYRVTALVSAHGGVCAGCHMALSPQTINLLKTGREVINCNHCSRLLYLG